MLPNSNAPEMFPPHILNLPEFGSCIEVFENFSHFRLWKNTAKLAKKSEMGHFGQFFHMTSK